MYFAVAIVWLSVSIAICYTIYVTRNPQCLWAFLIPAILSWHPRNDDDDDNDTNKSHASSRLADTWRINKTTTYEPNESSEDAKGKK